MTTLSKLNQYGNSFQSKVIGLLLTQKDFLINIYDSLDKEYFESNSHKWVVDYIIHYFEQYHTYPTMDILAIEVKKVENEVLKIAITESLRESFKSIESNDLEWVEKEFINFCRNQQMKKAIMTSVDLLNLGDYDGIRSLINNALKSTDDKNLGHIYDKDIESRYRDDDRKPIPFPWPVFNELTQGGYGAGDLILFFGNPKGGKSWMAVACGAYAAALGYNVLHYTLELGEGYVGKRYDSVLTGIPVDKLNENRTKLEKALTKIKGKIIIKEYSPKRASLDTIEAHITQLYSQEEFKPDLIIIDYLDLLKTKSRKEGKDEIDDIYTGAKGLAKELKIPIISPSQANRGAAKNEIIEGDNAAGSYNKIMIADILISLARRKKDRVKGTGKFHIMGNRYGPDGLTYNAYIDTSNGKIDINNTPTDDEDDDNTIKPQLGDFDSDEKEILKKEYKKFKFES